MSETDVFPLVYVLEIFASQSFRVAPERLLKLRVRGVAEEGKTTAGSGNGGAADVRESCRVLTDPVP